MHITPAAPSLDPPTFSAEAPPGGRGPRGFSLAPDVGPGTERTAPPVVPPPGRVALTLLAGAADRERAIDGFVRAAASGRTFTPGQLLAVQATVARYAQTVEVVSRAAARLVGAVKQTLGTQV